MLEDFKLWIEGKSNKNVYVKNIFFISGFLIIGVLTTAFLYEGEFSFLTKQISQIGNPNKNPIGSIIFSITLIITGCLLIPNILFFYRSLLPDVKIISIFSAIFLILGSIGLAMVGIFPASGNYTMHIISAIMAIGGIALSALASIAPIIKKIISDKGNHQVIKYLVIYGQFLTVAIMTIFLVAIPIINEFSAGTFDPNIPPDAWPICEWAIFFSSIIWACGMILSAKKE